MYASNIMNYYYQPKLGNTLQQRAQKCDHFNLFTFFHIDLIQSEASWKLSSTSDWLMSAWKNVNKLKLVTLLGSLR